MNIQQDPETGKTYDVSNPNNWVEVQYKDGQYVPVTEVIGTSPTTNEVLVRNNATGETYWKPGTAEQIESATQQISEVPDTAIKEDIAYQEYKPPLGVDVSKPVAGSIADISALDTLNRDVTTFNSKWDDKIKDGYFVGTDTEYTQYQSDGALLQSHIDKAQQLQVGVYTYRGDVVKIAQPELNKIAETSGKEQFDLMVKYGIIPSDAIYQEGENGKWSYATEQQIKEQQTFDKNNIKLPDGKGGDTYIPLNSTFNEDGSIDKTGWNDLPEKYQAIALNQGTDAMFSSIEADNQAYNVAAQNSQNITQNIKTKSVPEMVMGWRDAKTNQTYTDEQMRKMVEEWETYRDNLLKDGKQFTDEWYDLIRKGNPRDNMVATAIPTGKTILIQDLEGMWEDNKGNLYTPEERQKLIVDYDEQVKQLKLDGKQFTAEWDTLIQNNPSDKLVKVPTPTQQTIARIGVSLVPIVGTALLWNSMDKKQRGLSIATDALFFAVPFLVPKIAYAAKVMKFGSKEAVKIMDAVDSGANAMYKSMGKINTEVAESLKNVNQAAEKYALDTVQIRDLERAAQTNLGETQAEILRNLKDNAIPQGEKSYLALKESLDNYVEVLQKNNIVKVEDIASLKKPSRPIGASDDWEMSVPLTTKNHMELIKTDYIKSVDDLVDSLYTIKRTPEVIQSELRQAQYDLLVAKQKYALSPDKWRDIIGKINTLESELVSSRIGDINKLSKIIDESATKRISLEKQIDSIVEMEIRGQSSGLSQLEKEHLKALRESAEKELAQVKAQESVAKEQMSQYIKAMEYEWGGGGYVGGGRVAVRVKPVKPLPQTSPQKSVAPYKTSFSVTPTRIISGGYVSEVPDIDIQEVPIPIAGSEIVTIDPLRRTVVSPFTQPDIVVSPDTDKISRTERSTITVPAIKTSILEETIAETGNKTGVEQKTGLSMGTTTVVSTGTELETQPALELVPSLKNEVDTKTATKTKTELPRIKKYPRMIKIPNAQGGSVEKEILPGTITWRQGVKWEVLVPREDGSYHSEDLVHLDSPPPGTYKFATGKGSAYKTLQVIGGAPKKDAVVDLGWATVKISSKGKELTMKFLGGKEAVESRWAMEEAKQPQQEKVVSQPITTPVNTNQTDDKIDLAEDNGEPPQEEITETIPKSYLPKTNEYERKSKVPRQIPQSVIIRSKIPRHLLVDDEEEPADNNRFWKPRKYWGREIRQAELGNALK